MEIELVGHSNGGQLMQLYAAEGLYKDKVTSLVVAGSPLIRTEDDFPANLHALAFVVGNDPVPFNFTNWISVNWDRNEADYKDIVWDGSQPSVLGPLAFSDYANHDIANYINLAARFDAAAQLPSAPAVDQELLADIKRFSGVRVDSMNSLQIIPDAERVAQ
jgi:pimeloyl-ACP methyl ester carboxylesterase